jgi:predicted Zn finger-like uncharacterized protein
MAIDITCANCHAVYHVRDELAGRMVRCKNCGAVIEIAGTPAARAPAAGVPPQAGFSVQGAQSRGKTMPPQPTAPSVTFHSAPPISTSIPPQRFAAPQAEIRLTDEQDAYAIPARKTPAAPTSGDTDIAPAIPGLSAPTAQPAGGSTIEFDSHEFDPPPLPSLGQFDVPAIHVPTLGPRRKSAWDRWVYGRRSWAGVDWLAVACVLAGMFACAIPTFAHRVPAARGLGGYPAFTGLVLGLAGAGLFSVQRRFGFAAAAVLMILAAFASAMTFGSGV